MSSTKKKIKVATLEQWRGFIAGEREGSMTRQVLENGGGYTVDGIEWRPPDSYARASRLLHADVGRIDGGSLDDDRTARVRAARKRGV